MTNELSMKMVYYKKKLKLTNETLAKKTGLPTNTISRISSGATKMPTVKTLKLLANAFECDIKDLTGENDITDKYYIIDKTGKMAQELLENPELKTLLDAGKDLKPEEIDAVVKMIKSLKHINNGNSL